MVTADVQIWENKHLAIYEPPQLQGVTIEDEEITLDFDLIHSDTGSIQTSIENLERLSLTLD